NGATWGTPIWSANTTLAGQTFNVAVPVNSLAGLASGVRVRFEFVSTATVTQSDDPNDPFGFYVDDVKFESSNTNGFYTTF
ncbi:MAG TPA: hypothetical protein VEI97_01590, partial [bacterium]|nr:hypothetical protein [bacterium]